MIICLGPTPTLQRTMTFANLKIDNVNRAKSVREYASGKSTNVARVLTTLDEDLMATGFLGGNRAEPFRADLDRAGIAHDFVDVNSPTRLCTTAIDESAGTATELIEESGPVVESDVEHLLEKLKPPISQADLMVLSGTVPPGAADDFYLRCFQPNARVILDAVGNPLLQALQRRPFVIKPNQAEVERTLGIEIDTEEMLKDGMKELIRRGASWVVVTCGRAETLVTDGVSVWTISTPPVKVVSAIGSGDAFAAGLAAGLMHGDDVPQACMLGAACGAANALTPDAGHVKAKDVVELRPQIRLAKT